VHRTRDLGRLENRRRAAGLRAGERRGARQRRIADVPVRKRPLGAVPPVDLKVRARIFKCACVQKLRGRIVLTTDNGYMDRRTCKFVIGKEGLGVQLIWGGGGGCDDIVHSMPGKLCVALAPGNPAESICKTRNGCVLIDRSHCMAEHTSRVRRGRR